MMPAMSYPSLKAALPAERREIHGRSGRLSYYVAGEGAPLLLVHSINAAGSAYEVLPVFEHARATRRVYAVDLPGYGYSDRSARCYDVALFCDALRDMLEVIAGDCGELRVDALALSLASEFLARVASEQPTRFRSLALVTPTGFRRGSSKLRGPAGATRELAGLYRTLTFPVWRRGLYGALVSRRSIRYFLERTFGSDQVDEGLVDYAWLTTHQPGADRAPYAFLSARLFSADIRSVYEQLALPVWLAHGTRGDFRDFSEADWLRERPNWSVQAFDTGALVFFEQPEAFFAGLDAFLAKATTLAASPPRA
jgi:pimeloyl-ACP methyl ester carboxylesterase